MQPWFKLGPTYGEPEGTLMNDHHLSLAQKQVAREKSARRAWKLKLDGVLWCVAYKMYRLRIKYL